MSLVTPIRRSFSNANQVAEVGGALRQAYKRYAELSGQSRKRSKTSSNKRTQTSQRYSNKRGGSGFFKGRFNSAKTVSPTAKDLALTKGYGMVREVYGSCSGNNIIWLGASTFDIADVSKTVAIAILRKLFKKAGIDMNNSTLQSYLSFDATTDNMFSYGFTIVRQVATPDGVSGLGPYVTLLGDTLETMASGCGLQGAILEYCRGNTADIDEKIFLYQQDAINPTYAYRLVSSINLKNEKVHLDMKAKFVVQNRTKGSTSENNQLDTIDAQPLKGKMYHFNKSMPIIRGDQKYGVAPNMTSLLGRWSSTAVNLASDTSVGYDSDVLEPPTPYYFQNCGKSSNISLEPGDMKEVNFSNSIDQYYQTFVQKLAWVNGTTKRRQKVGDCCYLALEERLNSGSANPIVVQYELQISTYAYLSTGRIDPMKETYVEATNSHA